MAWMRRPLLLFSTIAAVAVVLILLMTWPSKIPRYHGRPVTAWLRDANSTNATQLQVDQAAEAVRAAGTNALGYWLELLSATNDPPLVDFWNSTIGRNGTLHRQTLDEKWEYAFYAFYFLGSNARPVLPELIKLVEGKTVTPNAWATIILLDLGPEGVSVVTNTLANTNCTMQGHYRRHDRRLERKTSLL